MSFSHWVKQWETLVKTPLPEPEFRRNVQVSNPDHRCIVLLSPHPDDEVIIGGLALRLQKQAGCRVVNLAITLGSDLQRRQERKQELSAACAYLAWELEVFDWERNEPDRIDSMHLNALVGKLNLLRPLAVFYPHSEDAHPTHQWVHHLAVEAIKRLDTVPVRIQTEFWHPIAEPNFLVESSADDVTELVTALSFHEGEIQRNPYHLRLPAWMIDNVRRGAERIGGKGTAAPDFVFGTIYHVESAAALANGILRADDDPLSVFPMKDIT